MNNIKLNGRKQAVFVPASFKTPFLVGAPLSPICDLPGYLEPFRMCYRSQVNFLSPAAPHKRTHMEKTHPSLLLFTAAWCLVWRHRLPFKTHKQLLFWNSPPCLLVAHINMNTDPIIIVFVPNPSWNPDIFDHAKHLRAAKARNATLRHLAHESCLNETRAVIFSYKALRLGTLIHCVWRLLTHKHMQTHTHALIAVSVIRMPSLNTPGLYLG